MTEHQLQNQLIGYLRFRGYYVERLNAGKYSVGEGRFRRFIMGVAAGTPDLLCIKNGKATFVEVKTPKNKPTALQKAKMEELEEYGCTCIVATSIEDLQAKGI